LIALCVLDRRVHSVCTLQRFVSSNHKPTIATFNDLSVDVTLSTSVTQTNSTLIPTPDWSKSDDYSLLIYETVLNQLLAHVDIPVSLLSSDNTSVTNNQAVQLIDNYYHNVMTCIKRLFRQV